MIDEKGKLFGKINLLDLILIVLFLAIAALAALFFAGKDSTTGIALPVSYVVEVRNQDEAYFNNVNIGEAVSDGITGAYLGTISGFEKKPAQVIVQADDALVAASPEGKFDGYITISADATASYPDIMLAGEPLKIGTSIAYRSETLAMHGYIVKIDFDEAELRGEQ